MIGFVLLTVVLSLVIRSTAGFDDLQLHWKGKQMTYQKPWVAYTDRFISTFDSITCIFERQTVVKILKILSTFLKNKVFVKNALFEAHDIFELYRKTKQPLSEFYMYDLALNLTVQSPRNLVWRRARNIYTSSHHWYFLLHSELRSKITFLSVRIHGHFLVCKYYLDIRLYMYFEAAKKSKLLRFCGIYENFQVYPKTKSYSVELQYGPSNVFTMSVLFDLISTDVAQTVLYSLKRAHTCQQRSHIVHLWDEMILFVHILYEMFTQIKITAAAHEAEFDLFDGPGFWSKRHRIRRSQLPFTCRTFQCILQMTYSEVSLKRSFFDFEREQIHFERHLVEEAKNVTFNHSNSMFCGFTFVAPGQNKVAMSLHSYSYVGKEHPECLYAGIIFIHSNANNDEICFAKENYFYHSRTVYSPNNSLSLVFFTNTEYANLQAELHIWKTHCAVVAFDLCEAEEQIQQRFLGMTADMIGASVDDIVCTIEVESSLCTVVQMHVRSIKRCENTFDALGPPGPFSRKISLKFRADVPNEASCHVTGIMSSLALIRRDPAVHESRFQITEPDNLLQIAEFKSMLEWKHGNRKQLNFTSRFKAGSAERQAQILKPRFGADLYFNVQYHTNIPTRKQVTFVGYKDSWVELAVAQTNHSRLSEGGTSLCVSDNPLFLKAPDPTDMLLITVNKEHGDVHKMQLHLNVTSEVRFCSFH